MFPLADSLSLNSKMFSSFWLPLTVRLMPATTTVSRDRSEMPRRWTTTFLATTLSSRTTMPAADLQDDDLMVIEASEKDGQGSPFTALLGWKSAQ